MCFLYGEGPKVVGASGSQLCSHEHARIWGDFFIRPIVEIEYGVSAKGEGVSAGGGGGGKGLVRSGLGGLVGKGQGGGGLVSSAVLPPGMGGGGRDFGRKNANHKDRKFYLLLPSCPKPAQIM